MKRNMLLAIAVLGLITLGLLVLLRGRQTESAAIPRDNWTLVYTLPKTNTNTLSPAPNTRPSPGR